MSGTRWQFVTGSTGPQMAVNTCACTTPGAAPHATAAETRVRREQAAVVKGRVQISDAEIDALSDSALRKMAMSFGWINSFRSPPITPRSGHRATGVVTNDVPFLPRPHALITRAEKEALDHPQTPTVGLSRPRVLINKSEREAGDQPVTVGLPRPRVLINACDR